MFVFRFKAIQLLAIPIVFGSGFWVYKLITTQELTIVHFLFASPVLFSIIVLGFLFDK